MHVLLPIFLILFSKHDLGMSNPMIGENVEFLKENMYPFVASIRRLVSNNKPENDHICSGVLISNKDVLTIQYCFRHKDNSDIEIRLGHNDLRKSQKFYSSWFLSYNEWAASRHITPTYTSNDIMIIRLNETVSCARPVSLSLLPDTSLYRSNVRVAGFGVSKNGVLSKMMETVEVTIISRRECEHKVRRLGDNLSQISDKYLCGIADPIALMSEGNSGSAVLLNNQLVGIHRGIVPSIDGAYNPEQVNLFMSINFYQQYINDVIYTFM